jgi:DNA adenine methylase
MANLVKSPLRYPGGKSKVVKFLAKFFPDFKELREPMCGGASITLYWVQIKPHARYIISDINYDLYCFWKELKENLDKLIKELLCIKNTYKDGKRLFYEISKIIDLMGGLLGGQSPPKQKMGFFKAEGLFSGWVGKIKK